MSLTPRMVDILKAIVDEFVATAEPVGSKTLVDKYGLPYSSATIRNDMAQLEVLGYLEKPHTSAGRIPSNKGCQISLSPSFPYLQKSAIYLWKFLEKLTASLDP